MEKIKKHSKGLQRRESAILDIYHRGKSILDRGFRKCRDRKQESVLGVFMGFERGQRSWSRGIRGRWWGMRLEN